MSSSKCRSCGLVNMASETFCRRCNAEISAKRSKAPEKGPRDAARGLSRLWSLLLLTIIGAAAWYLYKGIEASYEHVQANEAERISAQPKQSPAGLSRTQQDQQRAGQYGSAVQGSQGLNASQQHTGEINKLMDQGKANK